MLRQGSSGGGATPGPASVGSTSSPETPIAEPGTSTTTEIHSREFTPVACPFSPSCMAPISAAGGGDAAGVGMAVGVAAGCVLSVGAGVDIVDPLLPHAEPIAAA